MSILSAIINMVMGITFLWATVNLAHWGAPEEVPFSLTWFQCMIIIVCVEHIKIATDSRKEDKEE